VFDPAQSLPFDVSAERDKPRLCRTADPQTKVLLDCVEIAVGMEQLERHAVTASH
jgi:hypothetical protein